MTKQECLNYIATDPKFKLIIKKVIGEDRQQLQEDLFQHSYILFYDLKEESINKLKGVSDLYKYYTITIKREYYDSSKTFAKTHKEKYHIDIDDIEVEEIEEIYFNEERDSKALQLFDNAYWFDREIFLLNQEMTIREISRETKLSESTIVISLKRLKETIKEKINQ